METLKNIESFNKKFEFFLSKKILSKKNNLDRAIHYSVFSGGKRFRPYLVSVMAKEFKLPLNIIMHLSGTVELLHNYSLVHDDLPAMDNDKYRRGKKTTHYKFNEYTAILAGNALLTKAFELLVSKSFKIENDVRSNLVKELTFISGEEGLLKGQYQDLSLKKYNMKKRLEINKYKTGMLMAFCCQSVAIASSKSKTTQKKMYQLGMVIGEIFQINDDFSDFPKMNKKDTKMYMLKRDRLYKKGIEIMNNLNFKRSESFQMIDYVRDLIV